MISQQGNKEKKFKKDIYGPCYKSIYSRKVSLWSHTLQPYKMLSVIKKIRSILYASSSVK